MTAIAGEVLPASYRGGELSTDVRDPVLEVRAAWLLAVLRKSGSPHTKRAYERDIDRWFAFLAGLDVPVLSPPPRRTHVDAWVSVLRSTPTRSGRPPAEASLARAVCVVASFYEFAVDEGVCARTPVRGRGRPQFPAESSTGSLSRDEAVSIQRRLPLEPARDRAIIQVLLLDGLRCAELCGLTVGDIRIDSGHVVLHVRGKGGKVRKVVVPAPGVMAINEWLEMRASSALVDVGDLLDAEVLFPNNKGGRLSGQRVTEIVRRVCRAAGVASWRRVSPHWLRHAFATLSLDAGEPIDRVSAHMGHSTIATTQRYDRARNNLARTPVHGLAAFVSTGE